MIVDIPFHYRASVTFQNRRKHEEVWLKASHPVDLREIPADQTALVAHWIPETGQMLDYRLHRDRLIMPITREVAVNGSWQPVKATMDTVSDALNDMNFFENPFTADYERSLARDTLHAQHPENSPEIRTIHRHDREQAVACINLAARVSAIIDGIPYAPTFGPCWKTVHGNGSVVVEAEPSFNAAPNTLAYEFNGDRLDDIQEIARGLAERGGAQLAEKTVNSIDVYLPEALTFDDDRAAFFTVATSIVRQAPPDLLTWPRQAIVSLIDLRDALDDPKSVSTEDLKGIFTDLYNASFAVMPENGKNLIADALERARLTEQRRILSLGELGGDGDENLDGLRTLGL